MAQRNQRLLVRETTVLDSFREVLALLASQIRTLETAIAALIPADPLWQKLDQAFRSIKGVAELFLAEPALRAESESKKHISREHSLKYPAPIIHECFHVSPIHSK